MHELSLALNILDIASDESEARGGTDVKAIHIRLGPVSGVVKEALVSAFGLARESSPFSDCRLVIEDVPVCIDCPACEAECTAESIQVMRCSECSTPAARVISGDEMEITAMEIEDRGDAKQCASGLAEKGTL